MAYKDFLNDFQKGIIRECLCFYGDEDYLMDWAVDQLSEKFVGEEYRNMDILYLDGDTCSAAEIMGAARAYSMFSDRRLIIIRNFSPAYNKDKAKGKDKEKTIIDSSLNALLEFCKQKQDSSIVVFVFDSRHSANINYYGKKLLNACTSYDFSKLDRASIKNFINKRVQASGKLIGHKELDYLIDLSGYYNKEGSYSLNRLDSDLEKIASACVGESISRDLIEEIMVGEVERFAFALVDALMKGDKCRAFEIAETIIREEDGVMAILALLTKQFEIMYDSLELARQGMSITEMAKRTGINDYRFKMAYASAREFNSDKLKEILICIYNIDRDIKSGLIDKDIAFELLLADI